MDYFMQSCGMPSRTIATYFLFLFLFSEKSTSVKNRVAIRDILKQKIPIWVNFGGPYPE
jgi:hypothetical protein